MCSRSRLLLKVDTFRFAVAIFPSAVMARFKSVKGRFEAMSVFSVSPDGTALRCWN